MRAASPSPSLPCSPRPGAPSRERGEAAASALKVHTKFVPDWEALATIDSAYVTRIVDRSLHRLGVDRVVVSDRESAAALVRFLRRRRRAAA